MATNVDIAVKVKNEASGPLRQIVADMQGLDKSASNVAGAFSNLATGGVGAFLGGLGIGATVAAVQQLGGALMDLGKSAASFDALKASFEDLASTAGESGDQMLNALRNASQGMIADQDLILSANRAMMLGVAQNSQQMTQLLQVATVRGKAMGMSATDAFNDLVTGLGRMSPLILDNLGIVTGGEKVFDDYAKSLGRTAASLTDAERKQALFNKVVAESQGLLSKGTQVNPFAQLDASMSNLRIQAGQIAMPIAAEFAAGARMGIEELSSIISQSLAQEDLSGAGKFGYGLGIAIKDAIIAGLGQGGPIEFRTLFGDDFKQSATEAGLAARQALIDGAPEIQQAMGAALGDSSALTDTTAQMQRMRELEIQIRTELDAVMTDTQMLVKLMETGNDDLMTPVFDTRSGHLEELKRVRAEYATLMEQMRNVPGPVMPVSDSLWDGITGWRDLTRAAKDAVSPTRAAAVAATAAAAAEEQAAQSSFSFQAALLALNDTATATPDAITAAGNAINTIQGLMIQAAQAGADQGQAMAGFINAADMENQAANLARTLSSLGMDDKTIAWTIQLNTAEAVAGARAFASEAEKAGQSTEKVITAADRAQAAMVLAGYATVSFASGLSQVQAQAGATAGVIYNLTGAVQQLNATMGVMQSNSDLLGGVVPQLNNITSGLMNNMGVDEALAKGQELKIQYRDQIESLRAQGYTTAEIGMILQSNLDDTREWATGLDKVATATGGISTATQQVSQEYEDLKSKVSGILSGALDTGVGVKASDLLPREDDVNENARRLADIAVNGFKGQDWLAEFQAEAPKAYQDIMDQVAAGVDAKSAAATILRDFEDGMRPDLIDKGLVKERVKAMILGEQSMAALASEIAQELATEMNIPLSQALAAAGGAMGVTTGAAGEAAAQANAGGTDMTTGGVQAGQTFIAGFLAQADGTQIVAGIVAKLTAEMPKFLDAGKGAGTQWGTGFMSTVESGIANPLINLLVTLVTPGIMAQMAAKESQSTAP